MYQFISYVLILNKFKHVWESHQFISYWFWTSLDMFKNHINCNNSYFEYLHIRSILSLRCILTQRSILSLRSTYFKLSFKLPLERSWTQFIWVLFSRWKIPDSVWHNWNRVLNSQYQIQADYITLALLFSALIPKMTFIYQLTYKSVY